MGIYTWTDARRKPSLTKDGYDFLAKDKIGYGCYAKIVCPDGTEIVTNYYDGYGHFGATDVYDVIVDINKEDIPRVIEKHKDREPFFCECAQKYYEGYSEEEVTEYAKKKILDKYGNEEGRAWAYKEWKRNVGIMMCCNDDDNDALKYPLKITSLKKKVRYEDLYPSYNTQ